MGRLGNKELDERHEVLKLVDTGGTSQVFLVQDRKLNCQWAVKKIKKHSKTISNIMVTAEVNVLKSLNHPALPRIIDIQEDNEYFYIVMDYIQGENLRTILRADGAQPQDTVVAWGVALCDVLSYLHKNGIIYRDMKPSNIMLTPEGQIKLIDFGVARTYNPNATEDTISLGTEGYAAPEQYEGHGQSDARTDVFGVGVTLFQLLTNINPATYSENLFSIRLANPSLSSGLDRIIIKCTNKSKERRYQSAEELKQALLHYKDYDIENVKRRKKAKRRGIACFVMAGLFFVASGTTFFLNKQQTDTRYEALIAESQNKTKLEEAIKLKPSDSRAYIALLDSYGEEFDPNEASEFSHSFAEHQSEIKNRDEVSMYAGEKILSSYTEDSLRGKLLIAEPYFKSVSEKYERYPAANAYVNLASFYKNFIMQSDSSLVKEASKKDYEELLSNMNEIINSVSEYSGTEQKNLSLTTCEMSLNLIDEQCLSMKEQGISEAELKKLVSLISTKVNSVDPKVEVTKQKKENLLKQIDSVNKTLGYEERKEHA